MKWTIEEASTPGLYDVYDEDGNRVVRHTTHDRARLIADAPRTRTVLAKLVADIDACRKVGDFALFMLTSDALQQARAVLAKTGKEKNE